MSKARLEIISNIKSNPENAADNFIQLQKEFFALQQQLEQLHKDSLHADHVIAENRELKARNKKLERVVEAAIRLKDDRMDIAIYEVDFTPLFAALNQLEDV